MPQILSLPNLRGRASNIMVRELELNNNISDNEIKDIIKREISILPDRIIDGIIRDLRSEFNENPDEGMSEEEEIKNMAIDAEESMESGMSDDLVSRLITDANPDITTDMLSNIIRQSRAITNLNNTIPTILTNQPDITDEALITSIKEEYPYLTDTRIHDFIIDIRYEDAKKLFLEEHPELRGGSKKHRKFSKKSRKSSRKSKKSSRKSKKSFKKSKKSSKKNRKLSKKNRKHN